jgi:DNA-binding NtrC family response regulator
MQPKPRILFVDDEVDVLDALGRSMRRERPVWDMMFVSSGAQALEVLSLRPSDLVVSDLRMPGMDGAVLLEHIKRDFPKTTRVVLSGYADSDLFERAWPLAHLMLTKPCEHHKLREAIARMIGESSPAPGPQQPAARAAV